MEALHHFLQPTAWTYYTSFIIFAKQHAGHEIPSSGRCQIAGPEDWRMVDMNMYASAHMCEARVCTQQCDMVVVFSWQGWDFFSGHNKHDKVFQAQLQVDL